MASTFTTNKSIEKPANGDYVNTWSTPVNSDWDIIDASLGGTTTLNATGASGTVTLSTSQYRPPTIIVTGILTANVTYRIPSGVGGHWVVYNNTTGSFTITVDSGGGGTSTVIPQGFRVLVYSDGTNIGPGITSVPLAAAGSSGQIQFNSSGSLAGSSNLTYDGTGNLVLGGTTPGRLDVRNAFRIYGATSGYFGLTVPAAAGSTTYTLPNADGTSGQVLTTNGSGTLSWTTASGGVAGVTSFSAGTTGLTPAAASTGAVVLAGTLAVANGGTGQTTYTDGQLLIGNSTGNTLTKATLTAGTGITITNGSGSITISSTSGGLTGITTAATTALGLNAGDSVTSGNANVFVGYDAGTAVTTGANSVFVGYEAGLSTTTGNFTTAVGYGAARANVSASSTTSVGYLSSYNQTGSFNTAVGRSALQGAGGATTSESVAVGAFALNVAVSGTSSTAVGYQAGYDQTSANWSSFFGAYAGANVTAGSANTFVGYTAGSGVTTGATNAALGDSAYLVGNYSNSTCIGYDSAVNGSNQVQLGNSSTTTYAYGAVVDRASDIRDKADVQDTNLGLNFIMALRPRMYKWDYREDYRPAKPKANASNEEWAAYREACKLENLTHDGTHKRVRFHQGLIAQEVKQVMDTMGVDFGGYQDFKVKGGEDRLTIAYGELIGPLIKAMQELKAEFDEYKRTHP